MGLLRRLLLGLVLIIAASALLLFSDLRSRVQPAKSTGEPASAPTRRQVRIAVFQHASQGILDDGRKGMLLGLAERGWELGRNLTPKFFNAEGDAAVAQAIAKEMAGSGYDLLLTISTVSLQAVANANRAGQTPHVFGLVSDPYGAGVGINPANHLDHPAHLAGFGTMQPVALAFRTARECNPDLKRVGVVWNPAESNSAAQVKLARAVCAEIGITLLESSVENSAGVAEAASALVSRGVDALWLGGDVTVMTAVDALVAVARKARIPVFSVMPPSARRGTLFDVGADYLEIGRRTGLLAGDILNGRSPATIPIDNLDADTLMVNRQALAGLKPGWNFPAPLLARAAVVIDEQGVERDARMTPAGEASGAKPDLSPKATTPVAWVPPNPSGKKWKIAYVLYNETPPAEETLAGMKAAWERSALVAGRDYEIKVRSAQGDTALLSGIIDAALTDGSDLVVPFSTPALQLVIQKVKRVPVVFSLVANPLAIGAGRSYTDHLPNLTGVAVLAPVDESLEMLLKHFPNLRRFGTLFCPTEANSVDVLRALEAACQRRGVTLTSVAANTASDLPDAALALMSRPIDAVLQLSDNLSSAGFTAIARAARQSRKPLFSLNSTGVKMGAAVAFGRDYHNSGEATVGLIERVIRGEETARIPFELPPKIMKTASPANAAAFGLTLPPALLREFGTN